MTNAAVRSLYKSCCGHILFVFVRLISGLETDVPYGRFCLGLYEATGLFSKWLHAFTLPAALGTSACAASSPTFYIVCLSFWAILVCVESYLTVVLLYFLDDYSCGALFTVTLSSEHVFVNP